jgi:hypothetical protein
MSDTDAEWVEELYFKDPLALDPEAAISIKRDVHDVIVEADVTAFIEAFHEVMRTPGKMFGLIEILRPDERLGQPFVEGDRFQGRYSIEHALGWEDGDDDDDGLWERLVEKVFHWVENANLSDFGLVTEMQLDPAAAPDGWARFKYVYLDGTPIAGSTTFMMRAEGPGRCHFRTVFEYQEQSIATVVLFGASGLKAHTQVLIAEVDDTLAKCGGTLVSMTMPAAYRYRAE